MQKNKNKKIRTMMKKGLRQATYIKLPPPPLKPIPEDFHSVTEQQATLLFKDPSEAFYNKAQVVNRDLTILVLREFATLREEEARCAFEKRVNKLRETVESLKAKGVEPSKNLPLSNLNVKFHFEGISILDGLSATGLRAIRYAKEVPGVKAILANDLEDDAYACIVRNLEFNDIEVAPGSLPRDGIYNLLSQPSTNTNLLPTKRRKGPQRTPDQRDENSSKDASEEVNEENDKACNDNACEAESENKAGEEGGKEGTETVKDDKMADEVGETNKDDNKAEVAETAGENGKDAEAMGEEKDEAGEKDNDNAGEETKCDGEKDNDDEGSAASGDDDDDAEETKGSKNINRFEIPGIKEGVYAERVPFVDPPTSKPAVYVSKDDVTMAMMTRRQTQNRFDVVDLDPYGSAAQFLEAAVQSVSEGGLLCVTCTDMGVLCGNHGEVTFSKYGTMAQRLRSCHEYALRTLLQSIERVASKYKRYIEPLVSFSIDFYVRVFVRVYSSPQTVKYSPSKLAYVFSCTGCDNVEFQPVGRILVKDPNKRGRDKFLPPYGPVVDKNCEECGRRFLLGGPIWNEAIHDFDFVARLKTRLDREETNYQAFKKLNALLLCVRDELPSPPLYLSLSQLAHVLRSSTPPYHAVSAYLKYKGYKTSPTHCAPNCFKTDAPMSFLWKIMRKWVKLHPVKNLPADSAGSVILKKEEADLDITFDAAKPRTQKEARFLPNPERNWGPGSRAKGAPAGGDDTAGDVGEEMGEETDTSTKKRPRDESSTMVKPCVHFFKKGTCNWGAMCQFSHTSPEGETLESKRQRREAMLEEGSENGEKGVASVGQEPPRQVALGGAAGGAAGGGGMS
eukprot:Rmarinus@m.9594